MSVHSAIMRPIAATLVVSVLTILPLLGWTGGVSGAGLMLAQQQTPPPPPQQTPPPAQQPAPPPAQQQTPPPAQQERRVSAIEVRGNRRVAAAQILAVIKATKVGENVTENGLREDLRAIVELGLFADVTVRVEGEGDEALVIFIVVENPVIAEVIVEGNTVITAEEIRQSLRAPAGEVLHLSRMREGARAVEKLYEERGYVLARVADLAVVPLDEAENTARLRLRISEGRVEAVQFSGLRRTRDQTARRHLRETQPGKVFNINELNRDLQRLFDTGLFESIRAQPRPGTAPDTAVVVIEIREARTGQIGGGLGYGSTTGLLGFVEFRDRNWAGLGQTLALRAERSLQDSSGAARFNFEIDFTEPFLDDQRTALDLSLFSRASIEREYDGSTVTSRFEFQRNGAIATVSRPLDPTTTASLRLKSERTEITLLPVDENDPTSALEEPSLLSPGRVVSFTLSGARDTRNDRFLPVRGEKIGLSFEVAIPALGSDFGFTKYLLDYQHHFPMGAQATILGRVLLGSSSGTLPLQERFALGGSSTVRALPAGSIRDTSIVVANLEYRFSLGTVIRRLGELQGIVFVDAGRAPIQSGTTAVGYGVGVAIRTPVGPIRVDFAFGPEGRQTWLSLGSPF